MKYTVTNSLLILALASPLAAQVPTGQSSATSKVSHHKKHVAAKKVEPPPAPTQIAPMAPEQLPAQAPQVGYLNGQLTIVSQNSTLSDILSSVQRKTGVEVEFPASAGTQRVATEIGPATPREALTTLLQGTNFDYIIVGDESRPGGISRVMLTARQDARAGELVTNNRGGQPGAAQSPNYAEPTISDDEAAEPLPEQPPDQMSQEQLQQEPQQPPPGQQGAPGQPPGGMPQNAGQGPNGQIAIQGQQPGVRTPEQMLQDLQNMRQQQQQQQQQQNEQQQ
jgi:hypothetical protein